MTMVTSNSRHNRQSWNHRQPQYNRDITHQTCVNYPINSHFSNRNNIENNLISRMNEPIKIYLNVYHCEGARWFNSMVSKIGQKWGVYHSGVEVYGIEFCFQGNVLHDILGRHELALSKKIWDCVGDEPNAPWVYAPNIQEWVEVGSTSGIYGMTPGMWPDGPTPGHPRSEWFKHSAEIGTTNKSLKDILRLIHRMCPMWSPEEYSLINKNCCHFTEAFCYELCGFTTPGSLNALAGYVKENIPEASRRAFQMMNLNSSSSLPSSSQNNNHNNQYNNNQNNNNQYNNNQNNNNQYNNNQNRNNVTTKSINNNRAVTYTRNNGNITTTRSYQIPQHNSVVGGGLGGGVSGRGSPVRAVYSYPGRSPGERQSFEASQTNTSSEDRPLSQILDIGREAIMKSAEIAFNRLKTRVD
eukprot:GHVL01002817.1.p1 GENE.GHVL01002817.1~~GHVL01002817.1.p1  ORF type:complete len:425 (+),score=104.57 GHVL01002817.1:42-1277(+)